MLSLAILPFIAGLSYALPQDACQIKTTQIVVPTRTATYTSTHVVTQHPTTARDLGTFTLWTRLSSTSTLQTLTNHVPTCTSVDIV